MKDSIPADVEIAAGFFSFQNSPVSMAQVIDNSKVTDHHAIIQTMYVKNCDIHALPFEEREILLLIALRLVCVVGNSCRYAETVITAK